MVTIYVGLLTTRNICPSQFLSVLLKKLLTIVQQKQFVTEPTKIIVRVHNARFIRKIERDD